MVIYGKCIHCANECKSKLCDNKGFHTDKKHNYFNSICEDCGCDSPCRGGVNPDCKYGCGFEESKLKELPMTRKHKDGMPYLGQGLLKEWVLFRMKEQFKEVQVINFDVAGFTSNKKYHEFLVRIPSYTYKREHKKKSGAK